MSVFGWSYPAGCESVPDDEQDTVEGLPCVRMAESEAIALLLVSDVQCDPLGNGAWWIDCPADEESEDVDSIYFDHAVLEDGRVILWAVLDCTSTHSTETFALYLCQPSAALETAHAMVADAQDWFADRADVSSTAADWIAVLAIDLHP